MAMTIILNEWTSNAALDNENYVPKQIAWGFFVLLWFFYYFTENFFLFEYQEVRFGRSRGQIMIETASGLNLRMIFHSELHSGEVIPSFLRLGMIANSKNSIRVKELTKLTSPPH